MSLISPLFWTGDMSVVVLLNMSFSAWLNLLLLLWMHVSKHVVYVEDCLYFNACSWGVISLPDNVKLRKWTDSSHWSLPFSASSTVSAWHSTQITASLVYTRWEILAKLKAQGVSPAPVLNLSQLQSLVNVHMVTFFTNCSWSQMHKKITPDRTASQTSSASLVHPSSKSSFSFIGNGPHNIPQ